MTAGLALGRLAIRQSLGFAISLSLGFALAAPALAVPASSRLVHPAANSVELKPANAAPETRLKAAPAAKAPAKKAAPAARAPVAPSAVVAPAEAWTMGALGLQLTMVPALRRLKGEARFSLTPHASGLTHARLRLHPGLKVSRVDLNWRAARFTQRGEWLEVKLPSSPIGKAQAFTVFYAGRPLEQAGRARRQDLGHEGLMLHPQGRWFPAPEGAAPTSASVRLTVPVHWRAVAPSDKQTFDRGAQTYTFTFRDAPLAIAASHLRPYALQGLNAYLRPPVETGGKPAPASAWATTTADLARAQDVLEVFRARGVAASRLSGTLVELPADFAPLTLPFWQAMPRQPGGLSRWLAAAQWGLAVAATPLERQWLTQSLTAYSHDLMAERKGGQAGYRRAVAAHRAAYEAFLDAHPEADAALNRAIAPTGPAWQGVVVHKGALVWAQLREALGDEAFWDLLKAYQAGLSKGHGGWAAFQALGGRHADFLESWLTQPGLPAFRLREVAVTESEGAYQVTGRLVAANGAYALPLELALVAAEEVQRVKFETFGAEMPFHFVTTSKPMRLMVDPDERRPLRRRTHLVVSQGTAPAEGLIVYGTQGALDETAANLEAARAMQERLKRATADELPIKADTEVTEADRQRSLLLFGRPSTHLLADEWADQFPVRFMGDRGLWWQGRTYAGPDYGAVQIIANPAAPEQTVVLFAALHARGMAETLQYTRQGATFCLFDGDRVVSEGKTLCTFPDQEAVLY